jgi:hypothetical protein
MISTIAVQRVTTSLVALEHPDDWKAGDLAKAVANRAIDIGTCPAAMWSGETRTTLGALTYGEDTRPEDTDPGSTYPDPDDTPVTLTEDDL